MNLVAPGHNPKARESCASRQQGRCSHSPLNRWQPQGSVYEEGVKTQFWLSFDTHGRSPSISLDRDRAISTQGANEDFASGLPQADTAATTFLARQHTPSL